VEKERSNKTSMLSMQWLTPSKREPTGQAGLSSNDCAGSLLVRASSNQRQLDRIGNVPWKGGLPWKIHESGDLFVICIFHTRCLQLTRQLCQGIMLWTLDSTLRSHSIIS